MWRVADEPVIALDGDQAGQKAADRLVDLALPMLAPGKSLRFCILPEGRDPDPVFTWVSATGARPTLQALPQDLRERFAGEFRRALRTAYPRTEAGVVLPFRRVFAVAVRPTRTLGA